MRSEYIIRVSFSVGLQDFFKLLSEMDSPMLYGRYTFKKRLLQRLSQMTVFKFLD
jgi:hypothetical protein